MNSIRTKIIALLLLSIVFTSFVIAIMSTAEISKTLHQKAEENMTLVSEANRERLDSTLRLVEESVVTLSHYAHDALTDFSVLSDSASLESYIAKVEKNGTNHLASTVGATSMYFFLNPALTGEPAGFFWLSDEEKTALSEKPLTDISLYPEGDTENIPWWSIPVTSRKAMWLDAYFSKTLDFYIVSYVVPMYVNGTLLGVVGADVPCEFLASAANSIEAYETGFASILSAAGKVVYHPRYAYGETIRTDDEDDISLRIDGHRGAPLLSYRIDGENRKMAFTTLRNGMRLCIIAPDSQIYYGQNALTNNLLTIIIVSVFGATVIGISFTSRLTKPIKALHKAALEMQKGNLDVELVPTTRDEVGALTETLKAARDQLKERMDILYSKAHHDGLTGIQNATALSIAETEINAALETAPEPFAIAILDVNRLKVTNDILGHMMGDVLLRTVSSHLSETFGAESVFRFGGDEFAVLFRGEKFEGYEEKLAEGIRTMEKLTLEGYPDIYVSCAMGAAAYDENLDRSFADVRARADQAMYKNKSATKRHNEAWAGEAKGVRQLQIEKYLEFLNVLSRSTEAYLFLMEMESERTHFFGDIESQFAIRREGEDAVSLQDLLGFVYANDRAAFSADILSITSGEKDEHDLDFRWINRDGEAVWVNGRGKVIADDSGAPLAMIGRVSTSSLRPYYNPLTGLFNKERLNENIDKGVLRDITYLMLLDVDNLTETNIKYGRKYGDELLCFLAGKLEARFPLSRVYHMEQDRFALLLDAKDEEGVREIFRAISAEVADKCTISAATIPNDPSFHFEQDTLFDYARQLLAEKEGGDGSLSFFHEKDLINRMASVELFEEIEESIKKNCEGFSVHFQPQVRATDYRVLSAEALLRFTSPTKGNVFPDAFIPILERSGLIHKVGLFVLDTALAACKAWREVHPDFHISVNFSTVQLRRTGVAEKVLEALRKHDLPGSALTIEITESVQMEESDAYAGIFHRFQAAGIQIAIDDFGTGYSNLQYLKMLHADEIKIDRVFIRDIETNSYNYQVVNNILEFAKANQFRVCLEGVENASELAILESLHPDTLQGYLFGRPVTAEEFRQMFIETDSAAYKAQLGFAADMQAQREKMHIVRLNAKEILSQIHIGLWVIRISEDGEKKELFADAKMRMLLGVGASILPSECYDFWFDRIKPGEEDAVNAMVSGMATSDTVHQADYAWIHPDRGEILVRCTGKCVSQKGGMTVFEGFHRIISDIPSKERFSK